MVQISLWDNDFISFRCISRSGFYGSYGASIFNFLRYFHSVFHSGYTHLPKWIFLMGEFPSFRWFSFNASHHLIISQAPHLSSLGSGFNIWILRNTNIQPTIFISKLYRMEKIGNRVEEDRMNHNCITSYVYVFILHNLYKHMCMLYYSIFHTYASI